MKVTIVTPTLNAIEYFEECLQSIKLQQSNDFSVEHIVTDGGSTDGTVELAQDYGAHVLQGKDKGIFDAINKGSLNSTGELIGFLGADDVLLPGGLEAIVRGHREHGNAPWIVGAGRWIDARGESLGDLAAPPSWVTSSLFAALNWCPIQHVSSYVTRDFFEKLGGFNIRYRGAAEYDMWCRALRQTKYVRVPDVVAACRRTGLNFSMANRDMQEIYEIEANYAPRLGLQRTLYRYFMKLWVNGTNPGWTVRKLRPPVRANVTSS